jgi:hypothetical protein
MTPNSILHLAIFITVCEAFFGIDPHWGLWRKIFFVMRHSGGEGPHVVGGFGFVIRKEVKYFNFPMRESIQGGNKNGSISGTTHRQAIAPTCRHVNMFSRKC